MTAGPLTPTALVICSTQATCLPVMASSIQQYLPEDLVVYTAGGNPALFSGMKVVAFDNQASNFGDAYNAAIDRVFKDGHQYILIANDDIVFHPNTWKVFNDDLESIRTELPQTKMGLVGVRSDYVIWAQNIRHPGSSQEKDGLRWTKEQEILLTPVVAPILAWISREAWQTAQFPPTNWYSDNVLCWDLQQAGFQHFISRAYVHHAGSQTVGESSKALHDEAWPWVERNRPQLARQLSQQLQG